MFLMSLNIGRAGAGTLFWIPPLFYNISVFSVQILLYSTVCPSHLKKKQQKTVPPFIYFPGRSQPLPIF